MGNSDHVIVLVSINFPTNSKQDVVFHCIAYDYSCTDSDSLCDHLRDDPSEEIIKLRASIDTSEYFKWLKLDLMYISLNVSIWSNLTYLHGFQLLVLLP